MATDQLLPGLTQTSLTTERLEVAYLTAGTGDTPVVLVHGNCSSSGFFQDFMLDLAATSNYKIYAPDMRGYGDSEALPVDARRGVQDFSDDLAAFVKALGLASFHLLGWSLGGSIVMQYALDYPGTLRSLTLQAPGSPFGFGGSKGVEGTADWPDFAGSGAGATNPDFVQRLKEKDRASEQNSPRTVMNTFYFKPPFRPAPELEELYLTSLLSTRVGEGNYPGDALPSSNWPSTAPGISGVNNALSPKYLNQAALANLEPKPPVLWLRGADDQIVSDTSFFDLGFLGQLGFVPGWPGAEVFPPQPMVTQTRTVLDTYQANGGYYQEVVLPDCGHSPHIEKKAEVVKIFSDFLAAH